MQTRERVLVVESVPAVALRAARRIQAEGGEATIVGSVAEARSVSGTFDRGVFAFNLPDGTGIVLAAELMLEDRLGSVAFLHPHEGLIEQEHPSALHPASVMGVEECARQVA